MLRRWISGAFIVAVGCASGDASRSAKPKVEMRGPSASALEVVRLLGERPGLHDRIGAGVRLARVGDGYRVVDAPRGQWIETGRDQLEVTLPSSSKTSLRVGVRSDADLFVELEPLDVAAVEGEAVEGAVVFRSVSSSSDLVYAAEYGRVEELRWERSIAPSMTYRWKVRAGSSVAKVRVVDGHVQVLDGSGRVRIRTADDFAVDALGVRRDLVLALEGDELRASLDARGMTSPIAIDPLWTTTSTMSTSRAAPGAAPIPGNKVIVFGGNDGTYSLSTTEIYDGATGTWSAGAPMLQDRYWPKWAVLPSGQILVVAGVGTGGGSSETYDPATNKWTTAGNLVTGRWKHGLALNATSGKVYIAGGAGGNNLAEVWDPGTRKWSSIANMIGSRQDPGMIVLPGDTKILVVSGSAGVSTEIYDIATNTWSKGTDSKSGHEDPFVTRLPSGKIAVVAGTSYISEIYDPVAATWTAMSSMAHHHERSDSVLLPDGRLLADGGYDGITLSEIGDPATGIWTQTSPMNVKRVDHTIAALGTNRFLVVGGSGAAGKTAEIFQLLAKGDACTLSIDCASKLCVDGVCCDSACTGACQACDLASTKGTCSSVTTGAPHGSRSCAPYGMCAAGACVTSCTTSSDCDSTHYCSGGSCIARLANGSACTKGEMCASNSCTDGVCCESACFAQCQSCNESGFVGKCVTVSGVPRGTRPACTGTGAGTTCGPICNGADPSKCNYPTATAPCSKNGCSAGIETHASFCDGAGKCNDVPHACGAYECGTTGCKSVCTTKTDCAAGFFCSSGACVPATDLGKECSTPDACSTGYCVDGVCCGSATCAAGSSCANTGKRGTCSKIQGSGCSIDAECGSGHCVDGVCCNGECAGQCEACDIVGKVGTCWPVVGAPHGTRTKCTEDSTDVCKSTSCNGAKDTTKCVEFTAATVECRPAKCESATATSAATCDGAGSCRASEEKSCAPYACGETNCRTSCTSDDHCAPGNTCSSGACVPKPAGRCTEDGLSSIRDDGTVQSCSPYRCRADGVCATTCATSENCVAGGVCDSSGKCVMPPESSDGGCSVSHRRSPACTAVLGLLLLGAFARNTGRHARREKTKRANEKE